VLVAVTERRTSPESFIVSLISSLLLQSSGLVSVTDSEEPEESGGMRPALRPDEVDADDVIAGNP